MKNKGQVWIETVIYILIGLGLIGLVLAFVVPEINSQKDRVVIGQTIASLGAFDETIIEVLDRGKDNKRIIEFSMKVGKLLVNPLDNEIVFIIDGLEKPFSEPDVKIPVGRVNVETTLGQKGSSVSMTLVYTGLDLTYGGDDLETKEFNPSSIPYRFVVENIGAGIIDIEETSQSA
jgi:type II secretory pathway pseudopilin PulG